ncbi:MAG: hypothetical protein U5S82_03190 [Gammaproteobacteria bacterium]|nr:hypothetical protein [Gammaproteobacteria bacterium]
MEARGELRGGRFVQSFGGEQFALAGAGGPPARGPQTQEAGRPRGPVRHRAPQPGGRRRPGAPRPAQINNRILLRDGVPVAAHVAGEVKVFSDLDDRQRPQARQMLDAGKAPGQVLQFQAS